MEKYYWAALAAHMDKGRSKVPLLAEYFGSARRAYAASEDELLQSRLLEAKSIKAFLRKRTRDFPEYLAWFCQEQQVAILCLNDANYPEALKQIHHPPAALYLKGSLPDLDLALAMVGSRQASSYGIKVAETFAADLAAAGVVIISGGALGIDAASHRGALTTGKTVAVLGCGIDQVYPAANRALFEQICQSGALVTEFPPGTQPLAFNFPQRNRIIAGLAKGLLLVEAAKKSGAMITVDLALEEGREIYCIPGSIFLPGSIGCHSLIKRGAKLVDRPEDIFEDLLPQTTRFTHQQNLFAAAAASVSDTGRQLLEILTGEPATLEVLVEKSGWEPAQVSGLLLELQLADLVASLPGQRYYRI